MEQVILIDGVVGVGKTTLGRMLAHELDVKLYEELSDIDTGALLDKFYADKKRWSFTMQIHFLNKRFHMIKEIHKNNGGILDRSIFGDRIFASMLNEDHDMTDEEYRTYSTLLDNMLEHAQPPTILIYLRCGVDKAIERINRRDRGLESQVPRTYWERLNQKYEEWYESYNHSHKIVIDMNNKDLLIKDDAESILATIKEALVDLGRIKVAI